MIITHLSMLFAYRIVMFIFDLVLFIHACITDHHTTFSAFTASVGCILCWVLVRFLKSFSCILSQCDVCLWIQFFRTLRPFGRLGPFVSMVGYAVIDSLPFAMMGLLLMIGYSAAFMILFDIADGDRDYFDTFPHALETLFHTGLGNFEPEVSSVSRQHFLASLTDVFLVQMLRPSADFLTVWRALLFNSFVYVGPIVLMSLLVSILTDTHDRVRSKEISERTMHRLQAVSNCNMIGAFVDA